MGEKDLSERIDALESRLAYQDQAIEQLNETITAQWKQIDALTRQVNAHGGDIISMIFGAKAWKFVGTPQERLATAELRPASMEV